MRPHLLTSGSGTGTASHGGLTRSSSPSFFLFLFFLSHTPYSVYCHSCSRFRHRVLPCCRCEAHSASDSIPPPSSTAIDFRKRKSVVGEFLQGPEVYHPPSRPSICLCFQQINKTTSQPSTSSSIQLKTQPPQFLSLCVGPVLPWKFPFLSPTPPPPTASAKQRRESGCMLANTLAVTRCLPEPNIGGMLLYLQSSCR